MKEVQNNIESFWKNIKYLPRQIFKILDYFAIICYFAENALTSLRVWISALGDNPNEFAFSQLISLALGRKCICQITAANQMTYLNTLALSLLSPSPFNIYVHFI